MKKFVALVLVLILSLNLLLPNLVWAEEETKDSIKLAVSPVTFDFKADPGQSITDQVIQITNQSSNKVKRYFYLMDVNSYSEAGQVNIVNPSENEYGFSLSQWVKLSAESYEFAANETIDLKFSIKVPKNAEAGGHYGAIVIDLKPNQEQIKGTSGVAVGNKIAVLVALEVSGEKKQEASILSFKANKFINEGLPIEFSFRMSNEGNVHLTPTGAISIGKANSNEKVGLVYVNSNNDGTGKLLPKVIREYPAKFEKTDKKMGWGKYKATLSISYGNPSISKTMIAYFWILPWKMILIIGVGLLLWYFMKKSGKRGARRRRR